MVGSRAGVVNRMGRAAALAVACAVLPVVSAAAPAKPVRLAPTALDSLRAAHEKDIRETMEWLTSSPTSYLAAVGRVDYGERRSLVVGSGASADLRVADATIAAEHLRVSVVGDSFRIQALVPEAFVKVGDREVRDGMLGPGTVSMGRYRLRLSHQRYPALILFDPDGPHVRDPVRQHWYAYDPRYRFEASLTADPSPDTVIIHSTRGNERRALRMGVFELALPGGKAKLEAHRLLEPGVDEASVSLFFRDATTGKETYDVGRYLEPTLLPDGRWIVDLNGAYNPACAFSPHYNCPIPSKANTLRVAVRAGERSPTGLAAH